MEGSKDRLDRRVLTFQAGENRYGILLNWVCAVREGVGATKGKYVFREQEVPLVDLAKWLGAEGGMEKFPSLLVVGQGEAVAAFKVDSPGMAVSGQEMKEWPSLCEDLVDGVFQGVIAEEERLILVVDPEGICREITEE
jgi:chemotaxis signal transduction protein